MTLIGARIARTDAYATAVFVMGPDRGLEWAEERDGLEAYAVLPGGKTVETAGSRGFWWGPDSGRSPVAGTRYSVPGADTVVATAVDRPARPLGALRWFLLPCARWHGAA